MAAIQVSGLLSNQAFDWKTVVSEIIAADSIPITNLQTQETTNTNQLTALGSLQTDMAGLQSSLNGLQSGSLFDARTVISSNSASTWKSTSAAGATLGNYTFDVQHLATQAQTQGASGVGSALSSSSTVTGLTLATMNTATAITAGTFTVNGQQITVATTDSLQDVFDKIYQATGNDVSGQYTPGPTDGITLTSASNAQIVLGASNDTSNFLSVMKLANNGGPSTSSLAPLGTVETSATLANAQLSTPITGTDSSGNGSMTINGVSVSYNVNTDTVSTLLSRINQSGAGVTVTYDSANDRFNVANSSTGDMGMGMSDNGSGNLLAAMGLTTAAGGTFVRGQNAQFTINGGPTLTSFSNTLDSSTTGIAGFSVTVNTETAETLQIQSDTTSMQSAIQSFITAYNKLQADITTDTKYTKVNGTTTPAVLSSNPEVSSWASDLQNLAFGSVTGVTGSIQSLNDMGIGFADTTGQLSVIDSTKFANALSNNPQDAQNFFVTPSTGFVSKMFTTLLGDVNQNAQAQQVLNSSNTDLSNKITSMQTAVATEQTNLTNSFVQMLDAQSKANSQSTALTNAFFSGNSNNSCWVARAVYGSGNPRWLVFRFWLLQKAPAWFRRLYLRHGERFASWLDDKPRLRHLIRCWMDARIARLLHA